MSTFFYYAGLCWFVLTCLALVLWLLRVSIRPPRPLPQTPEQKAALALYYKNQDDLMRRYRETMHPD